jgi:hypothetical protein
MGRFIIMVALFALVFTVRLILDTLEIVYFEENHASTTINLLRIFHDIFTKLQWFGIYYSILEVFDIMNTLRSQSMQEYQGLAQTHKRRKLIVISTIAIFETIQILYEIDQKTGILGDLSLRKIIRWSDAVAEIVVVVVDLYVAVLFLNIIQFYIKH